MTAGDEGNCALSSHTWAAEQAGADLVILDGVQHWWPIQAPAATAGALRRFWTPVTG